MHVRKRTLRTAIIASSALGLTAGGSVLALPPDPPRRHPPHAPRRGVPLPSTPPASRPARTGSTTPPTGGLRATTRRPTTAEPVRDSRGRPTAPAPAARREPEPEPEPEPTLDGTGSASGVLFSPYKDVTINMNWNTDQMQSAMEGSDLPVVGSGSLVSKYVPKLPAITLAFATGACGSETWGGVPGASFATENVPQLADAGLNYVVSTGGEAGTFTCASTAGMESFIARYASPHLVGIDFDIEAASASRTSRTWSPRRREPSRSTRNCSSRSRSPRSQHPTAATAGSTRSATRSSRRFGSSLKNYVINLMTMDFGSATAGVWRRLRQPARWGSRRSRR